MSYNGIGLTTVRGSGTNGYVQRNLSAVRRIKEKVGFKTEEELSKLDSRLEKKPNQELIQHDIKRRVEVKCIELQELMEEQGYEEDEINKKVESFRQMLSENQECLPGKEDSTGRPIITETHQIAEMKERENENLRAAFGISKEYVKGSAFDNSLPTNKSGEDKPRYQIIRSPSRSPPPQKKEKKTKKRKQKKRRKKKQRSSTSDSESEDSSAVSEEQKSKKQKKKTMRKMKDRHDSSSATSESEVEENIAIDKRCKGKSSPTNAHQRYSSNFGSQDKRHTSRSPRRNVDRRQEGSSYGRRGRDYQSYRRSPEHEPSSRYNRSQRRRSNEQRVDSNDRKKYENKSRTSPDQRQEESKFTSSRHDRDVRRKSRENMPASSKERRKRSLTPDRPTKETGQNKHKFPKGNSKPSRKHTKSSQSDSSDAASNSDSSVTQLPQPVKRRKRDISDDRKKSRTDLRDLKVSSRKNKKYENSKQEPQDFSSGHDSAEEERKSYKTVKTCEKSYNQHARKSSDDETESSSDAVVQNIKLKSKIITKKVDSVSKGTAKSIRSGSSSHSSSQSSSEDSGSDDEVSDLPHRNQPTHPVKKRSEERINDRYRSTQKQSSSFSKQNTSGHKISLEQPKSKHSSTKSRKHNYASSSDEIKSTVKYSKHVPEKQVLKLPSKRKRAHSSSSSESADESISRSNNRRERSKKSVVEKHKTSNKRSSRYDSPSQSPSDCEKRLSRGNHSKKRHATERRSDSPPVAVVHPQVQRKSNSRSPEKTTRHSSSSKSKKHKISMQQNSDSPPLQRKITSRTPSSGSVVQKRQSSDNDSSKSPIRTQKSRHRSSSLSESGSSSKSKSSSSVRKETSSRMRQGELHKKSPSKSPPPKRQLSKSNSLQRYRRSSRSPLQRDRKRLSGQTRYRSPSPYQSRNHPQPSHRRRSQSRSPRRSNYRRMPPRGPSPRKNRSSPPRYRRPQRNRSPTPDRYRRRSPARSPAPNRRQIHSPSKSPPPRSYRSPPPKSYGAGRANPVTERSPAQPSRSQESYKREKHSRSLSYSPMLKRNRKEPVSSEDSSSGSSTNSASDSSTTSSD